MKNIFVLMLLTIFAVSCLGCDEQTKKSPKKRSVATYIKYQTGAGVIYQESHIQDPQE